MAALVAEFLDREHALIEVRTAGSVEAGVDALAETEFGCVISDHDMPGSTGIEFLRRVRESDPALPFVRYTGKGSEEVASEAISAGVADYLQKGGGPDQAACGPTTVIARWRGGS